MIRSWFYINFSALCAALLPPKLRKPIQIAWLKALTTPLQTLLNDFLNIFYPAQIFQTRYNSQQIVLTALLCQLFGSGIYIITNTDNIDDEFFYKIDEGYPGVGFWKISEAHTPTWFFKESEYSPTYDFTVYVPAAILVTYPAATISETVNKYKQAFFIHNIQSI